MYAKIMPLARNALQIIPYKKGNAIAPIAMLQITGICALENVGMGLCLSMKLVMMEIYCQVMGAVRIV